MYTKIFFWAAVVLGAIQITVFLKSLLYNKWWYPRHLLPRFRHPKRFPTVHLFVPCKGLRAGLENNLEAFATQDYPADYRITFITESADDPAVRLIQQMTSRYSHVSHRVAGHATHCSQKNLNLLAGIQHDDGREVYAFADSDVRTNNQWLRKLVAPLTQGQEWMSTGYCYTTLPEKDRKFSHYLESVFTLYQSKLIGAFSSMWGGSMALWRETFESLKVKEYWAETAVDDVTLFQLLERYNRKRSKKDKKLRVTVVPDLNSQIIANIDSTPGAIRWFARQVFYIKFYRRATWYLAIFGNFGNVMLIFLGPLLLLFSTNDDFYMAGLICLAYYLMLFVLEMSLPLMHHKLNSTMLRWLWISIFADVFGTFSLFLTLPAKQVVWSNIIYKVSPEGWVKEVSRPATAGLSNKNPQ